MLPDYSDIIKRAGTPDWYDENGAPRYGAFHPHRVTVYGEQCCLYLIACQFCGTEYRVVYVFDKIAAMFRGEKDPAVARPDALHFGDPPCDRHKPGCGGGWTANCEDLRVLEWWRRTDLRDWERAPENEIVIDKRTDSRE